MSLDIDVLKKELQEINAQRETASERIRQFSQRGRGRGRLGFQGGPGRGVYEPRALREGAAALREEPGGRFGEKDAGGRFGDREPTGRFGDRVQAGRFGDRPQLRSGSSHERIPSYTSRRPADPEAQPEPAPLPGSNKGRLASQVVVDKSAQEAEDAPGIARRPTEAGNVNPAVKTRNKRMFGQLLGTLQKFQEEDQRFKRTKLAQTRAEALQKAEQRAEEEAVKMREKQREDFARARLAEINRKRELDLKLHAKREEILTAQRLAHQTKLANFLRTVAHPPLLWLPKQHNEDTQLLLEQRQQDLAAWKDQQIAKMEAEKKRIEESFTPVGRPPAQNGVHRGDAEASQDQDQDQAMDGEQEEEHNEGASEGDQDDIGMEDDVEDAIQLLQGGNNEAEDAG